MQYQFLRKYNAAAIELCHVRLATFDTQYIIYMLMCLLRLLSIWVKLKTFNFYIAINITKMLRPNLLLESSKT